MAISTPTLQINSFFNCIIYYYLGNCYFFLFFINEINSPIIISRVCIVVYMIYPNQYIIMYIVRCTLYNAQCTMYTLNMDVLSKTNFLLEFYILLNYYNYYIRLRYSTFRWRPSWPGCVGLRFLPGTWILVTWMH